MPSGPAEAARLSVAEPRDQAPGFSIWGLVASKGIHMSSSP